VIAVDALLALAVAVAWLGALGFLRVASALDRLHCVSFVNLTGGGATLAAALVADGPSTRVLKIAILVAAALLGGAAVAHATGRALVWRSRAE